MQVVIGMFLRIEFSPLVSSSPSARHPVFGRALFMLLKLGKICSAVEESSLAMLPAAPRTAEFLIFQRGVTHSTDILCYPLRKCKTTGFSPLGSAEHRST